MDKFKLIKIHILSLFILEAICYIVIYIQNMEFMNEYLFFEFYVAIAAAIYVGVVYFVLSIILAIYAFFSKKIKKELKYIMYMLPIGSFYLPIPVAMPVMYFVTILGNYFK